MLTQQDCNGMAEDLASPAFEVVMTPMMERPGSTIVFVVSHGKEAVRLGLVVNDDIDGRSSNRAKDVAMALNIAYAKGFSNANADTKLLAEAIRDINLVVADEALTTATKITKIERILGGFKK